MRLTLLSSAVILASSNINVLADDDARALWRPVVAKSATATDGVTLRTLDDGTLLAEGANPATTTYEITFETNERELRALRIEFLTHESMPGNGPGRAFHGNFVLTEVTADSRPLGLNNGPEPIEFREAFADHSQTKAQDAPAAIDGDTSIENGWCPEGQVHHDDTRIVVVAKQPFGFKSGTEVRVRLRFGSRWEQHAAGRLRIEVTGESRTERLMPSRRPPANAAIEKSIDRGVRYLLALQQPDGSWLGPDWTLYPVGMTALGAYTLMHCGLRREHPAVASALAYVDQHDPIRTYDMGCVLMAYKQAGEPYPKDKVKAILKRLLEAMGNGDKDNPSYWGYPFGHGYPNDRSNHYDLSNTQYALLGMRAAAAMGERIPNTVFERIAKDVLEQQGDYGSFNYRPGTNPSASMVAAGMTCLLVCRDELAKVKGFDGLGKRIESGLLKGEDWFRSNWSLEENLEVPRVPNPNFRWYYYYVYGLERVGSIWNRRQFGGHDWYSEGAEAILKRQGEKGGWATEYGESDSNTCFALLFATRASSLTGKKGRFSGDTEAGDVAFSIHSGKENPLVAWVGELRGKVAARLDAGQKIAGVDWLLNGEQVATVAMPVLGTPTLERFTMQYELRRNGRFDLRARMRFIDDGGAVLGEEISNSITQYVDFVQEVRHRETVRDAGRNLAVSAAGAAVASSEWDGNYTPFHAIDGRGVTNWLCKAGDANPTLRLSFKRPPSATVLKLTQAQAYSIEPGRWSRPKEIEVQINGNKPQRYFLLDDSRVKQKITFKAATVKQVRVSVKSTYLGWDVPTASGFREVELFALSSPEAAEEISAFGAYEEMIKPGGSEPHRGAIWRFVMFDPGTDFAKLEFDDSSWSAANAPFGGGVEGKFGAPWDTTDLWARTEFTAPANDTATYQVHLSIDDVAEVYVNGVWIGGIDDYTRRTFVGITVPKGVVQSGRNVVAVKVKDTGGARFFDAGVGRYSP